MRNPNPDVEKAFLAYRDSRDPSALAAVYDGVASRLLAVALHLASSPNAAEDAVQDTFLIALEHPERWDATRPLLPWLMGILVNRVRQSAHRASRVPDPDRMPVPEVHDPESELQANEMLAMIDDAITQLPQPYRAVVLLRLRNGLSPADIAVALDRKPSTVRAQLARGFEMIRKVLPAGVAALFVNSMATARGTTFARQVVLQRAEEIYIRHTMQLRMLMLRRVTMALVAGTVGIALLWFALPPLVAPTDVEADAVAFAGDDEAPKVSEQRLPLPEPGPPVSAERVDAAPLGVIEVAVARSGVPMSMADVEIEPLGDPPRAFVHYTSLGDRRWRSIVPAQPNPPSLVRSGLTAASGAHRFDQVPVGAWVVRALGVCDVVNVLPDEVASVGLSVEPGARLVRGLVVDGDGRPLVGARVWTTVRYRREVRRFATTTNEAGRFELAAAPFTTVGVSHPGFAPVAVAIRERVEGPPKDTVFRLLAVGAQLAGQVVDGDGRGIAGIEVVVGHERDARMRALPGEPTVFACPERAITDGDGRFSLRALTPAATVVRARGTGYGVSAVVAELRAQAENRVRITMVPAATIRGTVTDRSGAAIASASVSVGAPGDFDYRRVVTAADGNYRIDGVTAGNALLRVANYDGGFASRDVVCAAGADVVVDVALSPSDLLLRGRVSDAQQRPFAGGFAAHHSGQGIHVAALDGEGRFAIPVSEREAAVAGPLMIFDHDPRDAAGRVFGRPRLVVDDLLPEHGVHELVVPEPNGTGVVFGRLAKDLGERAVVLRRGDETGSWRVRLDPTGADRSFQVSGLPAGRYSIWAGGRLRLARFDLNPRERHDCGELAPSDGIAIHPVHLALVVPGGASRADPVRFEVRNERGELVYARNHPVGLAAGSDPVLHLPAGRLALRATTTSGLHAERELIVDGRSARRATPIELTH